MEEVKRGSVFRLRLTIEEGISPKSVEDDSRNKYFIVLGVDETDSAYGFVVINSHINKNLPPVLQTLNYPLSPSVYSFLKNNSFVFCGEIKSITKQNFIDRYTDRSYCGQIHEEDLSLIIGALKSSPLITNRMLEMYNLDE